MPKPSTMMTTMERDSNLGEAVSTAEAVQPTKLISATTIIPNHSLR